MMCSLAHYVVANVLRSPEARFEFARPQTAALLVCELHRHLCIINGNVGAGVIPDARIGVMVASEPHRSRAREQNAGSRWVVNDEYPVLFAQSPEELIA